MRSWNASLVASAVALVSLQASATPLRAVQSAPPAAPQAAPPAVPQVAPQVVDAQTLLAAFARMSGMEARFEEEKHLSLLAAPLKSRGHIYFMRPGYLTRIVEAPEAATLRISPNELKLSGRDGEERIDLRQNDAVRVFVSSLVQVFSGDAVALERSYAVAFERRPDDPQAWTLTLTPLAKPLTDMLAALSLAGHGFVVSSIEVREPNGDRTVTRVVEVDVERRFTAEEQQTLFGIVPP